MLDRFNELAQKVETVSDQVYNPLEIPGFTRLSMLKRYDVAGTEAVTSSLEPVPVKISDGTARRNAVRELCFALGIRKPKDVESVVRAFVVIWDAVRDD